VVFVDGCFWHGCELHLQWPKNNAEFWRTKIVRNQARDAQVNQSLHDEGWLVLRFWEHDVATNIEEVAQCIARVVRERTKDAG
jgi:DNA mismatch endonuclease, patch repair protein